MIRLATAVAAIIAASLVLAAGIFWIGIEIIDGHEDITT